MKKFQEFGSKNVPKINVFNDLPKNAKKTVKFKNIP